MYELILFLLISFAICVLVFGAFAIQIIFGTTEIEFDNNDLDIEDEN